MLVWKLEDGVLRQVKLALQFAPLASQASGPPLSENEMSCRDRTFANLGKKLIGLRPLANQTIAIDDSVLGVGAFVAPTYGALIQRAFRPAYWNSALVLNLDAADALKFKNMDLELSRARNLARNGKRDQVNPMEANFALFFGVSLQLYQATLVADDTPFDRYAEGQTSALNARQLRGLAIFSGQGQCIHCHAGAELTSASFSNVTSDGRLDQRLGDNNAIFRYDNGFFNTGVRPTAEDPGVGGVDPFGNPFSETRMAQQKGGTNLLGSAFNEPAIDPAALTAVDGAFKTPGLRNVEFTGPYFHNGGKATLMQVVDFYNRGGDFTVRNQPISDPAIHPLGLTEDQKKDLVAFILTLSDDRVRFQRAPFDHPSICVPHGHVGNEKSVTADKAGNAIDVMVCLPQVGAGGAKAPLSTFLDLDPYQH
jgi:cytochrome c peroxidase